MNYKYLNQFEVSHHRNIVLPIKIFKFIKRGFLKLEKKQKRGISVLIIILIVNLVFSQGSIKHQDFLDKKFDNSQSFSTIKSLIRNNLSTNGDGSTLNSTSIITTELIFMEMFAWIEVPRKFIKSISEHQINSIDLVAKLGFGSKGMFYNIYLGLTIFAVIGALYKLVVHFLKTERFDNVQAFTGFFSYLGAVVLFIFSPKIVDRVLATNSSVSNTALKEIAISLDNELANALTADFIRANKKLEEIEKSYGEGGENSNEGKIGVGVLSINFSPILKAIEEYEVYIFDMFFSLIFKYSYYTFFICSIVAILAVPAFVIAFMVKVLLAVMVAGTKLVFLINMIPGFEQTWRSFMLNLVNIILWIPIFNEIIKFIQKLISTLITHGHSIATGEIIWLSIVALICTYQAIGLTTSAAGVIINGTGASMAGAMGGIASMNAVSAIAGAGSTVAGGAAAMATGGATAAMTSKSLQKYMK